MKLDFNDHLDDMMQRLMDEKLNNEQLELEIKRSKTLCQIAEKKIADKKIMYEAMVSFSNGDIDKQFITKEFDKLKEIEQK